MRCDRSHYLYVLRCRDGSFYTGMTDDIPTRVEEHRQAWAVNTLAVASQCFLSIMSDMCQYVSPEPGRSR